MKMSLVVPNKNISHFKTALAESGGWHIHNPYTVKDGISVYVQFPENCKGYYTFWKVYDQLTATIVEIDNRKWYTKYLNKIRNWWDS